MHKGRLARLARLGAMTAGLMSDAAGAVVHRVTETAAEAADRLHRDAATRMLEVFGEMKGLPLKAGQMLSYIDEMIPEEHRAIYAEVMGALQAHTPPMDLDAVEAVFREEFDGRGPDELFAWFDPEPIAAASIGQVYRARTHDGDEVVVKIQYPGIQEAIAADLANLGVLVSALDFLMRKADLDSLVRDVMAKIEEECDYENELRNQEEFRRCWAGDDAVVVPRAYEGLSTRRVLVSEYIEGLEWNRMLAESTAQQRSEAGRTLFRFVFVSLFRHGMFNGDPHPGNYLFLGGGRVCFIDYGCVQRYDDEKRADFAALREVLLEGGDDDAFAAATRRVFPMPDDLDAEVAAGMLRMMKLMFQPITAPQPYRFEAAYSRQIIEQTMALKLEMNKKLLRGKSAFILDTDKADASLGFLGRIAFGLASILTRLECEGDFRALLRDC